MKKTSLLCLGLFSSFLSFSNDWEKLETNTTSTIRDIEVISENEIIAIGADGLAIKSIDGGNTWNNITIKSTTNSWESVEFISPTEGFVGGQFEDIYKTSDGGDTWISVHTKKSSSSQVWDIDFLDNKNGIAVGRSGELAITTDGGDTWSATDLGANKHLGVDYVTNKFIYSVGAGQVAKSTDTGANWSKTNVEPTAYWGTAFVNETTGVRVGANGLCERTTDAGATWTKIETNTTETLYNALFTSMTDGYVVGSNGFFAKTMDAGVTWTKVDLNTTDALVTVKEQQGTLIVAGANGSMFKKVKNMDMNMWTDISLLDADGKHLRDVHILSEMEAVIVGANGTVIKTIDGGNTWDNLTVKPTSNTWETVNFTSPTEGFIGGQFENIYKTTDAGATWNSVYTINSGSSQIWDIDFLDNKNGIAVGRSGELALTTDGGNTWSKTDLGANKHLGADYVNADFIYSVGAGQVAKSTDAGANWTKKDIEPDAYWETIFTDDMTGYRVGNSGKYQETTDAGANWTTKDIGATATLLDVFFTDANTGYIVGGQGFLAKTTDAGTTWSKIDLGTTKALAAIHIANGTGYIVGSDGTIFIWKVAPIVEKEVWTDNSAVTTKHFKDIQILSPNEAIIVGSEGTVKKTIDGGNTWTDLTVKSTTNDWETIEFVNATEGYIGGQFENIYKTTDAGATWNSAYTVASGSSQIFDIDFLDDKNGIAVGRSGEVLLTSDAGTTWADQFSSSHKYLGAHYINPDFIYIVGAGEVANAQTGQWTKKDIEPDAYLETVFTDDNTGYRVGNSGKYQKTTDAGTTWTTQDIGATGSLRDVFFVDANKGYIVGNDGFFAKTMDAGTTWEQVDLKTTKALYAIEIDGSTGYIVGAEGTVFTLHSKRVTSTVTENVVSNVIAFPNPANDYVSLSEVVATVTIYSVEGQIILSANNTNKVNTTDIAAGTYFVQTQDVDGNTSVQRIIIQ